MIALLALLGLLLLPGSAWAHASLRGTDPPRGSRFTVPPPSIRLWFDEAVVPEISTLRVVDRSGKVVKEGPLKLTDPERKAAEFDPGKIGPGAYTVAWKVLSAVDGHVTRGVFAFAHVPPGFEGALENLGTPPVAGPGQQAWTWGLRILRVAATWAHLLGLLAIVGACLVWLAALRPAALAVSGNVPPQERRQSPPAIARLLLRAALVAMAGGLAALQLEWLQVSDAPLPQTLQLLLFFPAIPVALGTWSSIAAFIRLALLTGVASLATRLRERDPIAFPGILGLGMASLASIAVASHTAAAGGLLWALPDFLHLAAASLWTGGLVLLARLALTPENDRASGLARQDDGGLGRRDDGGLAGIPLREAMRRFTPWAAGSVIVLVLTGIASGTVHVPSWAALWRTLYGGTLAAKVTLLLPLLLLAWLNTFWCRGRLAEGPPEAGGPAGPLARIWTWGERRFRRRDWAVRGEVLLAAAALLCAAALTQLPPPKEAAFAPPPPTSVKGQADEFSLALTITSPHGLFGPSRVALSVLDFQGEPPPPDARVIVRLDMAEHGMRILPVTATPRGKGWYDAEIFFAMMGRWDLQVSVRQKGKEDATARFALNLGDLGFAQIDLGAQKGTRLSLQAAWAGRATRRRFLIGTGLTLGACVVAGLTAWRRRWLETTFAAGLLALGGFSLWSAMAVDTTPATLRKNPIPADAKSLEAGRGLYADNCAICHGATGKPTVLETGSTLMMYAVTLDLTADHMAQHTDGDLFWWIGSGIPGTPMPAFGEALNEEERWHLANYIRSLRHPPSGGP